MKIRNKRNGRIFEVMKETIFPRDEYEIVTENAPKKAAPVKKPANSAKTAKSAAKKVKKSKKGKK